MLTSFSSILGLDKRQQQRMLALCSSCTTAMESRNHFVHTARWAALLVQSNPAASCCCRVSYYVILLGSKIAFCFAGQATALGRADPRPVTRDNATKDAAAASKGSSDLPNQETADRREAEEQQDDEWEPSPAAPKRKAVTRGNKKAEPARKPRRGRKQQQPVVESDSQDSESFAEEEELASSSQLAEVPAVRKSRRRKHQVRAAAQ